MSPSSSVSSHPDHSTEPCEPVHTTKISQGSQWQEGPKSRGNVLRGQLRSLTRPVTLPQAPFPLDVCFLVDNSAMYSAKSISTASIDMSSS